MRWITVALGLLATACGPGDSSGNDQEDSSGVPVLGNGSHDPDTLDVTVIGTAGKDDLETPTDLAFHPDVAGELWVVNQTAESVTVFSDVGTSDQTSMFSHASTSEHFLAYPSGIAFGNNGLFATSHDKYEPTQGGATGADFMGPTLWDGDAASFDAGDEAHMDMLHNSPNGKGIAWEKGNRYWVFDGFHDSITMYDFNDDHGRGGTDHTDGEIARYVEGKVKSLANVPSHLVVDKDNDLLYIADSGKNRIAVLDTTSGDVGDDLNPNFDGCQQYAMDDADLSTWVDGDDAGLEKPVGIALHDGLLFVSDVDLEGIYAFDLATAELVDWLDLGRTLYGIEFDDEGSLYAADPDENEIIRIAE